MKLKFYFFGLFAFALSLLNLPVAAAQSKSKVQSNDKAWHFAISAGGAYNFPFSSQINRDADFTIANGGTATKGGPAASFDLWLVAADSKRIDGMLGLGAEILQYYSGNTPSSSSLGAIEFSNIAIPVMVKSVNVSSIGLYFGLGLGATFYQGTLTANGTKTVVNDQAFTLGLYTGYQFNLTDSLKMNIGGRGYMTLFSNKTFPIFGMPSLEFIYQF